MAKWTYSVAKNQEESESGNFEAVFDTEDEAKAFAETIGEDAVILESEYLSTV